MDARGEQLRAALENARFNEKSEKFETAMAALLKEVGSTWCVVVVSFHVYLLLLDRLCAVTILVTDTTHVPYIYPQAMDESFTELDPATANFERRIKAHKEFGDEIAAQGVVKQDLVAHADALIKEGHFAAEAIAARKDGIAAQWEALLERSEIKRQRLQECHE